MSKDKFLLVSLKDSKELAQAVSNESCRIILEYLADQDSTESELATKLSIPLSTVHYNLQLLCKAGLVVAEEFHYSKKGREVNHYKLANKLIIIAPKTTYGWREKLKSIVPVVLGVSVIGLLANFINGRSSFGPASFKSAIPLAQEVAYDAVAEAAPVAVDGSWNAVVSEPNVLLWFFVGAVIALVLYLLVDYFRNRN